MNQKEFTKTLSKKRMAAGVCFFDQEGNLLLVKPVYKNHWSLPGGVINENESPREGVMREVKEELGLDIKEVKFLGVDYVSEQEDKTESLQFVFYGGILTPEIIQDIKLPKEELSDYQFIKVEKALLLVGSHTQKRLPKCLEALKNNTALYLENND